MLAIIRKWRIMTRCHMTVCHFHKMTEKSKRGGVGMPKETFFHLSDEKQQRIMKAAQKEFSRASLGEASIAQIIKDADIPRGSFYQYFEDKDDLYFYYFRSLHRNSHQELEVALRSAKGNLFLGIENYFSKLVKEVLYGENASFYQNLFLNMDFRSFHKVVPYEGKNNPHGRVHHRKHEEAWQDFYDLVDLSQLTVKNQDELKLLIKMLMHIVFSTIAEDYRLLEDTGERDGEKFMADFQLKVSWLKNGVWRTTSKNLTSKEG